MKKEAKTFFQVYLLILLMISFMYSLNTRTELRILTSQYGTAMASMNVIQ